MGALRKVPPPTDAPDVPMIQPRPHQSCPFTDWRLSAEAKAATSSESQDNPFESHSVFEGSAASSSERPSRSVDRRGHTPEVWKNMSVKAKQEARAGNPQEYAIVKHTTINDLLGLGMQPPPDRAMTDAERASSWTGPSPATSAPAPPVKYTRQRLEEELGVNDRRRAHTQGVVRLAAELRSGTSEVRSHARTRSPALSRAAVGSGLPVASENTNRMDIRPTAPLGSAPYWLAKYRDQYANLCNSRFDAMADGEQYYYYLKFINKNPESGEWSRPLNPNCEIESLQLPSERAQIPLFGNTLSGEGQPPSPHTSSIFGGTGTSIFGPPGDAHFASVLQEAFAKVPQTSYPTGSGIFGSGSSSTQSSFFGTATSAPFTTGGLFGNMTGPGIFSDWKAHRASLSPPRSESYTLGPAATEAKSTAMDVIGRLGLDDEPMSLSSNAVCSEPTLARMITEPASSAAPPSTSLLPQSEVTPKRLATVSRGHDPSTGEIWPIEAADDEAMEETDEVAMDGASSQSSRDNDLTFGSN